MDNICYFMFDFPVYDYDDGIVFLNYVKFTNEWKDQQLTTLIMIL